MPYVAPSFVRRAVGRVMAAHGEACILQRAGQSDLPVRGKKLMRKHGIGDVVNSFADLDLCFRIGNDELAAAGWGLPRRGDVIKDASGHAFAVHGVDTRDDGSETLMHTLWVAG